MTPRAYTVGVQHTFFGWHPEHTHVPTGASYKSDSQQIGRTNTSDLASTVLRPQDSLLAIHSCILLVASRQVSFTFSFLLYSFLTECMSELVFNAATGLSVFKCIMLESITVFRIAIFSMLFDSLSYFSWNLLQHYSTLLQLLLYFFGHNYLYGYKYYFAAIFKSASHRYFRNRWTAIKWGKSFTQTIKWSSHCLFRPRRTLSHTRWNILKRMLYAKCCPTKMGITQFWWKGWRSFCDSFALNCSVFYYCCP